MALALALLGAPSRAEALELSGGVGLGGFLAGAVPHLAVSPHGAISWSTSSGFMFAAHEMASIILSTGKGGPGIDSHTAATIGYTSEARSISVGPSLSIYSMVACNAALCGRVAGVALGGHAQGNIYLYRWLGVSVNAGLDWISGRSRVLPGGVAAMVVAGPVVRWSTE